MRLINQTKKRTISKDIYFARSFFDSTFGLILKSNRDLHFKTRFGIHTLFMRHPIDIIVTDSKMTVVAVKKNLKPYRIFTWNPTYYNVYELKQGSIDRSETQIGDSVALI